MRTQMKRLTSWLLAFLMLFSTVFADVHIQANAAEETSNLTDPVSDDLFDTEDLKINDLATMDDNAQVSVVGQVVAFYGISGKINTAIIEDVINGEIVGFQLYNYNGFGDLEVGDIVRAKGALNTHGGVQQIKTPQIDIVKEKSQAGSVIGPQVVTIEEITNHTQNYISEYVILKGVSIEGSTVSDANGKEVTIYKAAPFPDGVTSLTNVDLMAVVSEYDGKIQLRNGSTSDYILSDEEDNEQKEETFIPRSLFQSGDVDVRTAASHTSGTISVVGQVVALYGSNGSIDSALIEDVINGTVYGYQLYKSSYVKELEIGSIIRATGTAANRYGVPQITVSKDIEVLKTRAEVAKVIQPIAITIDEIKANASKYLNTYVKIKGVTLEQSKKNVTVTDVSENTISIYNAAEIPEQIGTDQVDILAVVSTYNTTPQLRNGSSNDYIIDPVTDECFEENDLDVKEAATKTSGTISVVGQVVALYGNAGSISTAIIEDYIDGEIYGYQIYGSKYVKNLKVGSIIRITGSASNYHEVNQIQPKQEIEVVKTADEVKAVIGAQVLSIGEIQANSESYISEYVQINSVKVGPYKASSGTVITDKAGCTISIYQSAALPEAQEELASADVLAVVSKNYSTIQLRNGDTSEFKNYILSDGEDDNTEEVIPEDPTAVNKGSKFIYFKNSSAEGVFKGFIFGGCAGIIPATMEDGKLTSDTNFDGAAVFTYMENSDGTVYFKVGNQYLAANDSEQILLVNQPYHTEELDTKWVVEDAASKGFTGYTVKSSLVKYSRDAVYMEYFPSKGFCLYTCKTMSDMYCFQFVDATGYDEDGDGYVGQKKENVSLPEVGKTYVIYSESAGKVIGPAAPVVDGSKATMGVADAVITEGNITVENGGMIFTVLKNGEYYRLKSGNKYLGTDESEAVFMAEENALPSETACIDWALEATTEGILLRSATAVYSGVPIYVEYFSGGFAGYTVKAGSIDIFLFDFYEYKDEHNLGYVINPSVDFKTNSAANLGVDYTLNFELKDLGTVENVTATVTFEDGTVKTVTANVDASNYGSVSIPKNLLNGHTSMTVKITVSSKETESLTLSYSGEKTVQIEDCPVILTVTPAAGAQTGENKTPEIKIQYANIGDEATATLKLNGKAYVLKNDKKANCYTYVATENMPDGKYIAEVVITRKDGKQAAKQWVFYVGQEGVNLYFGQVHSHTAQYSDGSGTLEQAFDYAMNKAADIDYMIITDHSNYFDTTSTSIKDSIYDAASTSLILSDTIVSGRRLNLWEEAKETAKKYQNSEFVGAYGYEMTWSGGPGHINVFNSKGIVSRNNSELNNKTNYSGMYAFYDLVVDANKKGATWIENGTISGQFNHPGTTFGTFGDFIGYTPERDEIMNLIEVGNGDGAVGGTAYFPSYEYYDQALANGWHIAPTNGQDNHKGAWGDSNTCRTVVLADTLTEEAIYEAMALRQVYSTEDQNLSILYYLNDNLQGAILDDFTEDKVKINVTLSDNDIEDLGYVYIIGENGAIRYTSEFISGNTADLEVELDNTDAYYYVKVVQKDGDIAVTAPVWVADVNAKKVKMESAMDFEFDDQESHPVVGNETVIKDVLKNNETTDVDVNSFGIYVDEELVFEANAAEYLNSRATGAITLASQDVFEVAYSWMPENYGTHEVKIVYALSLEGEDATYVSKQEIYVQGEDYHQVTPIDQVHKGQEGEEFTVEGIITANTSGYDKNTAFFDCTYVQDATGGINVFPVSGNFKIGQKVRVHGAITYYNGEIELNISEEYGGYIEVISDEITPVEATKVSCKDAMEDKNIGLLMSVTGKVVRIHEASGAIDRIYVEDETGVACIYINGYILNGGNNSSLFGDGTLNIKVGDFITAVGIGSIDVDELGEVEYLHRLRVRNRAEIMLVQTNGENQDDSKQPEDTDDSKQPEDTDGSKQPEDTDGSKKPVDTDGSKQPVDKGDSDESSNQTKPEKMGDVNHALPYVMITFFGLSMVAITTRRKARNK